MLRRPVLAYQERKLNFQLIIILAFTLTSLNTSGKSAYPSIEGLKIYSETTNNTKPVPQPESQLDPHPNSFSADLNGDGIRDVLDTQVSDNNVTANHVIGSSVEFHAEQLCNPDFMQYPENLKGAYEIDVNLDSISELLLFIQYNNNARFHLFYSTDCGFAEVTDSQGGRINFLSYASSITCQPIGCLEQTFCTDNDEQRKLVNVSGRHTLTLDDQNEWLYGDFPDADITSQIAIKQYRLVEGMLIEVDSRVVPNVVENMELFNPTHHGSKGDGNGIGFSISSCV